MAEEPKQRLVKCVKLGRELPGLDKPPRNDDLGKRIYENVSAQGWKLWLDQQTILINHYGLSLVDQDAREFLAKQLEEFFFGEGAQLPDDWIPEEERGQQPAPAGKGGQAEKGGAPASKGSPSPAPAQK
ncbi:MAG: oxidative damage protection protein [Proteobacteria bacterium]|nr:oxidative damage protection protein [Pseudomonadota bacterium]